MFQYFDEALNAHQETVEAEKERKGNVKRALEEAESQKLEDKKRRKAAREAQRKANEMRKLKEEIYTKFVQKGELKE